MKKHRLHDIVLGMLLMALIMGLAIPALASTIKTIEANYMDIKLVVDGVPITPKDAAGNVVEPFAFEGTTYLPVRAVGEALGKDVKWEGETKTVYVGEIPGKINYLVDVCPPYETGNYELYYKEYHSAKAEFFKMGGKDYSNGFTMMGRGKTFYDDSWALVNLDGEYKSLTLDVGHVDGEDWGDAVLEIYLDGEFSRSYDLSAESSVKNISIPLNNALQLKMLIYGVIDDATFGFANAILE